MVKADFTRDYYGDLEIQPTADLAEIKKQFKKLALTYHPDRNPGRESEVTAKFQRIQSAHEVLSDPNERAKYDSNRVRPNGFKTGYQGASGVRGNPWANAGAQWAPPPKRPGANRAPPPSAGAARYGKFETPKASANTANEGAEARKKTYEAWESMRSHETRQQQAATGRSSWKPPPPARDYTTPSAREESNKTKHTQPPKTRPGFDEYHAKYSPNVSPHRRAQSTGASNRRGFVPATPGGDEPAAPKSAYFTQHKASHAPEPPPRNPPPSTNDVQPDAPKQNVQPDPLRQFRERVDPTYEARQSTPYQTHGGEKLNPFENANLNRSKSYRERSDRPGGAAESPRTGSEPHVAQPHRSRSFVDRPSKPSMAPYTEEALNSSSSDDGPGINSPRKFAQPRRVPTGSFKNGQGMPEAAARPEHTRKPSLSQFQKWYRENPGAEPPLNGFVSEGPPAGSGQANPKPNEEPNLFSFKVDDNTFATTKPRPNGFTSPSTENINTKFTPEEWTGKFEAGNGYFMPEQKAAGVPPRGRAQSGTRSRGRSPIKIRPIDPKVMQPRVDEETPIESPGGTKFTPEEWAQSFKPQTFMPPPPAMPPRSTSSRKGRTPSIRTTMGGNAAVVDDSENTSDEKPLFPDRKAQPSPIVTSPSPDPMEVDSTPPVESTENQVPKTPSANTVPLNATSPSKRAAVPSHSPTDSALKVEFDDLKLRDLISHLNLPVAPVPPKIPVSPTPEYTRPLKSDYEAYLRDFKAYMCDWDLFTNQFMFHILARKKHNDEMGAMRWEDDTGLMRYRMGLREDNLVLGHWSRSQEKHQGVMKEYAILKEQMKDRSERERPRKKTH